jgi:hypothetical protein
VPAVRTIHDVKRRREAEGAQDLREKGLGDDAEATDMAIIFPL